MKHKNLFLSFVVISIFVLFVGCSDFFGGNFTTDVQFKINLSKLQLNSRSATRTNEVAKLSVELTSQDKSVSLKQEQNIIDNTTDYFTFKNIKVGTTIKITATISQDDKEIYFGETEWLDVKPSKNLISLNLEKIEDESEEPDVPEKPETPSNPETPTEVTLTFDSNGGTSVEAITGIVGENFTAPAAPTKTGYTFDCWEPVLPEVFPKEDITFKAKWTPNAYTVTFDANDGSSSMAFQSFTYDVEQALAENRFTRTGYTFAGWSTTSGSSAVQYIDTQSVKNLTDEPNGKITLYAQWNQEGTYSIYYDLDYGVNNPQNPNSYKETDNDITLYDPTRTGYTFEGWKNEDGNIVTSIPAGTTGNITLYAQWTVIDYAITYELYEGDFTGNYPETYTIEDEVTLVSPNKPGYTFEGWYTNENFNTKVSEISKGTTGEITLYAKWTAINQNITVTFPSYSDPKDILQKQTEAGNTVTFTAKEGYTNYTWYLDDVKQPETSNTYTIDTTNMAGGIYTVMVVVKDSDGEMYSDEYQHKITK